MLLTAAAAVGRPTDTHDYLTQRLTWRAINRHTGSLSKWVSTAVWNTGLCKDSGVVAVVVVVTAAPCRCWWRRARWEGVPVGF